MPEQTEFRTSFGAFTWEFEIRERIDVELIVEELMKTAAFYQQLQLPYQQERVSKSIKDAMLKNNINV